MRGRKRRAEHKRDNAWKNRQEQKEEAERLYDMEKERPAKAKALPRIAIL